MTATSLVPADQPIPDLQLDDEAFSFDDMRVFTSIPEHHHDVVALGGIVAVYETDTLCREPIRDGAFYVVESQYPVGGMSWQSWLDLETAHGSPRAQPHTPLKTRRRVIKAVWRKDRWWHALPSGFHDGPFDEWAVAFSFVGKVAGVYQPSFSA